MKLKLRVDMVGGDHVHCTLFMGLETLANCGKLCFLVGEYQIFGAALSLGADKTNGHLHVEHDDKTFADHNWDPQ